MADEGAPDLDLKPTFAPVSAAAALQVPSPVPTCEGLGAAAGRSMLSRHAAGGQRGAWHVVLAARQ